MFAKKIMLAAAALAALTAAGLGSASAQPRDHFRDHRPARVVVHNDFHRPHARPYVSHVRVYETLRHHRFAAAGRPYFMGNRYVVRSHDRFGHPVLVRIDPWTGRYIGVIRL